MKVMFLPIIADFLRKGLFGVVYISAKFDELVTHDVGRCSLF